MNLPNMLISTLYKYGFEEAAKSIMNERFLNVRTAVAAWENYPRCLDHYPMKLYRKPHIPELKMHTR